jgi:N,N'-diacetyllegionaminate synthase
MTARAEAGASVRLGSRVIGPGERCYLIAEVGTTCLGNLALALELVRVAAESGIDAVKFQVIDPDQVSDPDATYPVVVDGRETRVNMKEMFAKLKFSEAQWREVAAACAVHKVDFFATVDRCSSTWGPPARPRRAR